MKQLNTILDWIRFCTTELSAAENKIIYAHGSSNAFDEAHSLILGLLKLPYNIPSEYFNAKLTEDEIKSIIKGIDARINDNKPVAYITNNAVFMGLNFYVDERVLIPRSPIFELIENQFLPYVNLDRYQEIPDDYEQENLNEYNAPLRILDLCTGSGCIGIACAYMFPLSEVILSDISSDAIDVANKNIKLHDIDAQVFAVQSDLFEQLKNYETGEFEKFDIIVSNPPYVDSQTMEYLPKEFKHEPQIGLESGEAGLDCTHQILKQAINYLNHDGWLIVEVGASWDLLEEYYPEVEFNWHQFEKGGEGVFVMSYNELAKYQHYFTE